MVYADRWNLLQLLFLQCHDVLQMTIVILQGHCAWLVCLYQSPGVILLVHSKLRFFFQCGLRSQKIQNWHFGGQDGKKWRGGWLQPNPPLIAQSTTRDGINLVPMFCGVVCTRYQSECYAEPEYRVRILRSRDEFNLLLQPSHHTRAISVISE